MEIYTPKPKIKLSPVVRNGREFVEVTFGNDNDIRLSLSKEENVLLVGGRAYMGHRTKRILRIERKEYQTY